MDGAYEQVASVGVMHRLRRRLFPAARRPILENDPRTYLSTTVHVYVDWPDWFRLLLSGHGVVQVTTYTDVLVNRAESVSVFSVEAK